MPRRRGKKFLTATQQRKRDHLELCLDTQAVTDPRGTGWDRYSFLHNALPEVDIAEIDLSTSFLDKPLKAPLLISSMTGGFELARKVNRNLAVAAQKLGLA
ncbi:type 2 isopentenyl-diphosphate Delta-isomerase, partial [bacterium]